MRKICVLFLILVFSCVTCYATDMPTLSIIQNESIVNNEIDVSINISKESGACGGKVDVSYDNKLLSPKEYKVSEELSNSMCFVNLEYEADVIRISWAGTEAITTDTICTLTFTVNSNTSFTSAIAIKQAKIADVNSETISVSTGKSEITYVKETPPTSPPSNRTPVATNTDKATENIVSDKISTNINFVDVEEKDWYYESVKYVVDNKLMNGVSETKFVPNGTLTRAMLVTVLYRNVGEPAVNKSIPFTDVDMGSWYANAVVWAKQNGIVNGVNETDFAPDNNITREQIAAIMFRYAQYEGMEAVTLEENLHFADDNEISEYAVSAMNWAVGTGLMKGKSTTTINPKDNATRAEIAAILQRFIEVNK